MKELAEIINCLELKKATTGKTLKILGVIETPFFFLAGLSRT